MLTPYLKEELVVKKFSIFILVVILLTNNAFALSPAKLEKFKDPPEVEYSDEDLNRITNVVNGEVGGICGTVKVIYSNGSIFETDGDFIRRVHARVVDNQVHSSIFPDTVSGCVRNHWSTSYDNTSYKNNSQWKNCRIQVLNALTNDVEIPNNLYAATCDSSFAQIYSGWYLWAKVSWNTGWCSGTFYYYCYNG